MLPTFVIGLREGLEAALIVGIIAAFLGRQGRRDLLRWVYVGVGTAVLLCLGVGIALKVLSSNLPQKQQEGLETVIGAFAVGMVTYMVVWMRQHARGLKRQLEQLAAGAIEGGADGGAGRAMVLMAFLAVLREGFETVVFLLAAFNESSDSGGAAGGAVAGIVLAVLLGYGVYRGGVRLNLSKFFRATGLVLVLVAAGLVVNALHTAHEASWLDAGQGTTVDLSWLVRPGSVQSALLTGMLGIQPHPVTIEVIGWLVYLVPVGLYVASPPGRGVSRRTWLRVAAAAAGIGTVAAIVLAVIAPSAPGRAPVTEDGALSAQVIGPVADTARVRTTTQSPASSGTSSTSETTLTVHRTGSAKRDGVATDVFTASVPGTAASSMPVTLTYTQAATLNGGRLPLGVVPAQGSGNGAGSGGTVSVQYADVSELTVWIEPNTGRVIDLSWTETVHVTLISTRVGRVPLDKPVATGTRSLPASVASAAATSALHDSAQVNRRSSLYAAAWGFAAVALAGLLTVAALLPAAQRATVDGGGEEVEAAGAEAEAEVGHGDVSPLTS